MKTRQPALERIIERLQDTESLDLEFKDCRGGLSHDLWETVCAFANTAGGWLILGVDNKGTMLGLDEAMAGRLVKELYDTNRNTNKLSREVFSESDVKQIQYPENGRFLIVARVAAVPRTARPVFLNNNPMTGTFIRRHEGDYRCRDEEVKRMFRDASSETMDSVTVDFEVAEALSKDTIRRYRQRFQNRNPEHEFNDYDEDRFLAAIEALDEKSGKPTLAGLLMFGTPACLRKWRKRHLIDFRVNAEQSSDTIWIDRLPWEGNLLDGYLRIYPRLTEGIPVPHLIRDAERIEDTPAHVALREAFINLLVHTDYAESDASLIFKSPEGYFFRNPGASRVARSELLSGNRSDPRNPNLLFMFRLIGLADEAGSGIPKIIRNWKSLGFKLPDVEVGTERYEFVIHLRNAHLLTDEDRTWLKSLGKDFDEHQQLALICARHEGQVDNERLRAMSVLHPSDATRILTGLRDNGFLAKESDKRGAFYVLPPLHQVRFHHSEAVEHSSANPVDGGNPSIIKDRLQTLKETIENLKEDAEILKEMSEYLKDRPSRSIRRQLLECVIVRLCKLRPRKAKELAGYLGMNQVTLNTSYLTPMLKTGQIGWTGSTRRSKAGFYVAQPQRNTG